jgi:hypothetical protein
MNKPVSALPCMRERAFLYLCVRYFYTKKSERHRKNLALFKYGKFLGRALPPRSKKMTDRLVIMTKNSARKGGLLSLSEVRFFYSLYIFIIYIF